EVVAKGHLSKQIRAAFRLHPYPVAHAFQIWHLLLAIHGDETERHTIMETTTRNSVGQHYSEQWDLLDSFDTLNLAAREQKLIDILPHGKEFFAGKRVMIGGSGYGWETLIFHRWGAQVTGVDLFTDAARRFLQYHGVEPEKSGIQLLQQN